MIRYSAVITLSGIFGKSGDYGPSVELFDKEPEKHIALWKQSWNEEGSRSINR